MGLKCICFIQNTCILTLLPRITNTHSYDLLEYICKILLVPKTYHLQVSINQLRKYPLLLFTRHLILCSRSCKTFRRELLAYCFMETELMVELQDESYALCNHMIMQWITVHLSLICTICCSHMHFLSPS